YYPGWWEPGPSMYFMVNRQAWDQLPQAYKDAFEVAAVYAMNGTQTIYDRRNPEALERLVNGGTQLRRYPDDVMQAARDVARDLLEQSASRDALFRKVYDAFLQFREDSFRWFGTAEQEFARFAFGNDT